MAKFLMMGKYSSQAIKEIGAKRTKKAEELLEELGGKLESAYALMGAYDLVLIVELPGFEDAVKASIALNKMTGISFSTSPAMEVSDFDRMMEEM
ncbi:MAG: hypothetical protein COT16_02500 [Elusimicrobia bacterium CG08_land_8_20_14_0_20_44_26]|nr:MAG: hypothetical protein COT16_02500 [Elusimicrobia bacterium CG08_land_8_20_14_0_20_44_26]